MGAGATTTILEVSEAAELDQIILSEERGVLVEFWGTWCRPCRVLRPHLERFARDHSDSWLVVAVHAERNPGLVDAWSVKATPTLVYLRDGEERHRTAGAVTPSMIEEALVSVV